MSTPNSSNGGIFKSQLRVMVRVSSNRGILNSQLIGKRLLLENTKLILLELPTDKQLHILKVINVYMYICTYLLPLLRYIASQLLQVMIMYSKRIVLHQEFLKS